MLKKISAILVLCSIAQTVYAGHPLVTEDTATQDAGNHQIEINTDWSRQNSTAGHIAALSYSYGVFKNLDGFINTPFTLSSPSGLNDIAVGVKWRFFEEGPLSFVFKPELHLATGDENKGFGTGSTSALLTLVTSYEAAPWTLHGNVALTVNRYKLQADEDAFNTSVWRASGATWYAVNEQWRIIADAGLSRSAVKSSSTNPAYALTGVIYSPSKNLDFDIGVKFGLNKTDVNHQIGIGLTWRF